MDLVKMSILLQERKKPPTSPSPCLQRYVYLDIQANNKDPKS